jgi:outer membrane protein
MKWLLFDFGRRKGRVEEARQTAMAADAGVMGARQKLAFDVSQAYFALASANASVRASAAIVQAARTTEEAVIAQHQAGRATVVAVAEAQRQVAAARLTQVRAQGSARSANAVLISTVGLPADLDIVLADDLPLHVAAPQLAPIQSLVADALRRRPDLRAADNQVSAAGARLDAARAAYRPTISMTAQAFQNAGAVSSDGSRYATVNRPGGALLVAFELPLVDGGTRRNNVAMANSQVSAALDQRDAVKDQISAEVVRANAALLTATQQHEEAEAYVAASNAAYQAMLASFKRGLSTVQDIEGGTAALAEAIAARESARADLQVAIAQLALATGTIAVDEPETGGAGKQPADDPNVRHDVASDIHIRSPGDSP